MGAALFACSSGSGSSTSSTPTRNINGLSGPIDYKMIADSLAKAEEASNSSTKSSLKYSTAANITFWAGTATLFIPSAAPVLGPLSKITGIWAHVQGKTGSQLQAEQMTNISNELYELGLAVDALNSEVNELSSAFANFVKVNTGTEYATMKSNYNTYAGYIGTYDSSSTQIGAANFYYTIMNPVYNATKAPNANESNIVQAAMVAFNCLNGTTCGSDSGIKYVNSLTENYNNAVAAISGSFVNATTSELNTNDIYKYVSIIDNNTTSTSNYLYGYLYYGLQDYLEDNMPVPYSSSSNNLISTLNAYNTWVVQIFEQNISYLQSLYLMEATNNTLNYIAYIQNNESSNINYICPFEPKYSAINFLPVSGGCGATANPALSGKLSNSEAAQVLLTTQQNLSQLFAARVNALYQVTIANMVGDKYSFHDEQSESTINMVRAKFLSNLDGTSIIGGDWTYSLNLYQYNYVSNVDNWKSELINSAKNNTPITNPPTYMYSPIESQTSYNGTEITTFDNDDNLYILYYGQLCGNPYSGTSYPTSGSGLSAFAPNKGSGVNYVNSQAASANTIPACMYYNVNTNYVAQNGYYGGTSFQVSNSYHDSFTVYFTNGIQIYNGGNPIWTTMNFNNNQNDYVAYFTPQPYVQTAHYQSSQNVETGGDSNSATILNLNGSNSAIPVAMVQNNTNSNQYLYLNCLTIDVGAYNSEIGSYTYSFVPSPNTTNEFYTCSTGTNTQITGQKDDLNNSYYTYTTIPSVTVGGNTSAAIYFQTEVYSDTLVPSITGSNTAYLNYY